MAMSDYLCFTTLTAELELCLEQYGTVSWTGSYSTDGSTWTTYTLGTSINLTNVGDKVYFKGTLTADQSEDNYLFFQNLYSEQYYKVSGNVMSLTHESDFTTRTELSYAYEFYKLFQGCTGLTKAPELPATTLTDYCYYSMFEDCTSLTQVPELPATTLTDYCYYSMFEDCTGLTKAPKLPATTLATYCYYYMFYGCTSLQYPPELPATILYDHCYHGMFYDCTSLLYPPELPATTLTDYCYHYMFYGCTLLKELPELPALVYADSAYWSMFEDCTSIKLSETKTDYYSAEFKFSITSDKEYSIDDMFSGTGGTFTGIPTINTTYYIHKDYPSWIMFGSAPLINLGLVTATTDVVKSGITFHNTDGSIGTGTKAIKTYTPKYIQLDYVNWSGGTDSGLIVPDVYAKSTLVTRIAFALRAYGGGMFFGSNISDDSGTQYRFFGYQGEWYWDLNNGNAEAAGGYRLNGGSIYINSDYTFELGNRYVKNVSSGSYVLGSASTSQAPAFSSTNPLCLFTAYDYGRCYYIQCYDSGTLVCDAVPAMSLDKTKVGLYNKVTGNFNYASGVTYGSEVGYIY